MSLLPFTLGMLVTSTWPHSLVIGGDDPAFMVGSVLVVQTDDYREVCCHNKIRLYDGRFVIDTVYSVL